MMRILLLQLVFLVLVPLLSVGVSGTDSVFCPQAFAQDGGDGEASEKPSLWQRVLGYFQSDEQEGQEPVFEKYSSIFNYIHQDELSYFDSLRQRGIVDWDRYFSPDLVYEKYYNPTMSPIDTSMKVFGWHPNWMGDAYKGYQFKLLTHVAWFSYNLNTANGSYTNPGVIEEWKNTEIVELAHADGCQVLLTVTSHKREGNRQFLDNALGQQLTFIDSITALVKLKNADGVDLNFENIPLGYEKKLSGFIRALSDVLTSQGLMLTVSLPKLNRYRSGKRKQIEHRYYEIDTLQRYVDFFVVTAYDFYHPYSKTDGPIAPLYAGKNELSIENVVYSYLEDGLDRKKLVLGLPYYGAIWKAKDDDRFSESSVFDRHMAYRETRSKAFPLDSIKYDSVSWSAYYVLEDTVTWQLAPNGAEQYNYTKYWFDDSVTLRKKYAWAVSKDLGGVGIWALGYDNKHLELWSLIDEVFTRDHISAYQTPSREELSVLQLLVKYKLVLMVAGIFLFIFLAIGFVAALFDWRVREVFFSNKTLRILYIVGGFTVLLVAYIAGSHETGGLFASTTPIQKMLLFVLGLGLGVIVSMLVVHFFERSRQRLP
jgi:spore germination protein YaaH